MKLSIPVVTYNHESYIAKAIEGFLIQKTNFSVEMIIGEDYSTDKTREICVAYQKKYPDKIKLVLNKKNIGGKQNFLSVLNTCKGKYIAMLEGDDYWTDPLKLQKQVDFLDNNPDYSISSHRTQIIYEGTTRKSTIRKIRKKTLFIEDILKNGGESTCSLVFKNKVFNKFPDDYEKYHGGDYIIQVLCTSKGKMKYFPEIMGVYRVHNRNAHYTITTELEKRKIDAIKWHHDNKQKMLDSLDKHLLYKYSHFFHPLRIRNYLNTFNYYFLAGDIENSKKYSKKLLLELHHISLKKIFIFLTKLFITYLPKKYAIKVIKYRLKINNKINT